MSGLDASAAAALRVMAEAGAPSLADLTPQAARLQYDQGYAALQLPHEEVAEATVESWQGLRVKIWRGHGAPRSGGRALLYLHGGGWVIGAIESHEEICRRIANRTGSVVIAPDYRLAPETPFPGAIEDCVAALRHLHEKADTLAVDPARIAVGGDSAGGNLAAVLALLAKDGAAPAIAAQLLIYPNTDQAQNGESFRRFAEGFGLSAREMAWFRSHYLPTPEAWQDWLAAPLLAPSLHGIAPAAVILAGHDVLYSEGAAYAARLEAESRASVRCWPGQIHGFLSLSALIPEANEALDWLCDRWMQLGG
ncbi:alpha/beta hydrolase [Jiella pacifica]|uniref:Alpha/beta hydrolase fold domain-containing protein n=1 Tax=Jiella pacifica TaxID=2696469 RepID=A0A6N9T3T2_9HYPH|nr:alpha/beta hydrolase [Jiella pacifica]NDW05911.1 alpha/beta hydrolase fold domain-containing protein [Jiella pacifica]